jgi:hypothetical protein
MLKYFRKSFVAQERPSLRLSGDASDFCTFMHLRAASRTQNKNFRPSYLRLKVASYFPAQNHFLEKPTSGWPAAGNKKPRVGLVPRRGLL